MLVFIDLKCRDVWVCHNHSWVSIEPGQLRLDISKRATD